MKTYIYETTGCCDDLKYYEIRQQENEAPLTAHPETGEAIKRVVLGGRELVKDDHSHGSGSCGCGTSGCC
jgi:predicted nucleic acid-binding Zn ribbon protein